MVVAKTRQWGNSLGVRIPAEIVKDFHLKPDQDVEISIKPSSATLEEMFGQLKEKLTEPTEKLLRDVRKDTSKHF